MSSTLDDTGGTYNRRRQIHPSPSPPIPSMLSVSPGWWQVAEGQLSLSSLLSLPSPVQVLTLAVAVASSAAGDGVVMVAHM